MTVETLFHANRPDTISLNCEQSVGHADHWSCFTDSIPTDVPFWIQQHIETATLPKPLVENTNHHLLLSENQPIHINQILELDNAGKPKRFINAFPCVNSPYGQWATIESIYHCEAQIEAILRLKATDGTIFYVFDQFFAINHAHYQKNQPYYINLSALAYEVKKSDNKEKIIVDEPEAIRYHRAFSDILNKNNNIAPPDLHEQIAKWQPNPEDLPLEPIEISVANMCAYLFGDTIGQQDEAWCQGQVIGKQSTTFNGIEFTLLDVVILRESLDNPVVVRTAVNTAQLDPSIGVNDYIQANIWLQGTIFVENQNKPKK